MILPGSAYTEQDGHFANLEGKIQKAYKASFPPGDAKEDWQILNELSELLKRKKLFVNKDELSDSMFNYLNVNKKNKDYKKKFFEFLNEKIYPSQIEYYFSNVIARSSKTMAECHNVKFKMAKTGTEN